MANGTTGRRLIAGNWKMNGLRATGTQLAGDLADRMAQETPPCDLLLCPPFTLIPDVADAIDGSGIALGGQDCHAEASGAYTGSVSAPMLFDLGCSHVIVGHSERRHGLGENDATVLAKADAARKATMTPIVCVGETAEERDAGRALDIVAAQIRASVPTGPGGLVVAYEPVWAIGTGRVPTLEDIAAVHAEIRKVLRADRPDAAEALILYGGSAKPENAADILAVEEVGGLLVGGASLKAADFWAIATSCD